MVADASAGADPKDAPAVCRGTESRSKPAVLSGSPYLVAVVAQDVVRVGTLLAVGEKVGPCRVVAVFRSLRRGWCSLIRP